MTTATTSGTSTSMTSTSAAPFEFNWNPARDGALVAPVDGFDVDWSSSLSPASAISPGQLLSPIHSAPSTEGTTPHTDLSRPSSGHSGRKSTSTPTRGGSRVTVQDSQQPIGTSLPSPLEDAPQTGIGDSACSPESLKTPNNRKRRRTRQARKKDPAQALDKMRSITEEQSTTMKTEALPRSIGQTAPSLPALPADEEDEEERGPQATAKAQRHRERNRRAAQKCRQKSKVHEVELHAHEQELVYQNRVLCQHVAALQDEVLALKHEILKHGGCDCDFIQNYIAKAAQQTLGRK